MGEKIELCLTSELSLNNSITTSTRTLDTMDSTTSLFRHQSSLQHSQDTDKHSRQRKIAALILFQLLITTVSVTAVVLAAIAFSNYYDVMHNDDTDIKTLENRIMTLERMLNQSTDNQTDTECANPQCITHQAISETIENFTIILYKQLHINFSYTESQINKVSTEIMDHLRDQIGQLNTTVDINLERIMSVNHTLNMLSSQVQDATQRDMNTTANLYDNCIVDHEMCSGGQLSNIYWRVCATSYLPLNVTGYFTVDMACDYESNYSGNMVSTVLQKNSMDGTVQCKCNILLPDHYRDNFFKLPYDFTFVCNLKITRCPVLLPI